MSSEGTNKDSQGTKSQAKSLAKSQIVPHDGESIDLDSDNSASGNFESSNKALLVDQRTDKDASQLSESKQVERLEQLKIETSNIDPELVSELMPKLSLGQEWFRQLPEESQDLVCRLFIQFVDQNAMAKELFEDKKILLMAKLNESPDKALRVKHRMWDFCWKFVITSKSDNRADAYTAVTQIMGESYAEAYQVGHIVHPQTKPIRDLTLEDEGLCYCLPAKMCDMLSMLRDAFKGEDGAESDIGPVLRKHFGPLQVLKLISVIGLTQFERCIVTEKSPDSHKLLVELLHECRSNKLEHAIYQAFSEDEPETSEDCLASLGKLFKEAGAAAQQVMFEQWTTSCQLKATWLKTLSAAQVLGLIEHKTRPQQLHVLSLCPNSLAYRVWQLFSKQEQVDLTNHQLLRMTGHPSPSFKELETAMRANKSTVEHTTRKFVQAVPLPGRPHKFICVEEADSTEHFYKTKKEPKNQEEDKAQAKDEDEDEDENEEKKPQFETVVVGRKDVAFIDVTAEPLFEDEELTARLTELEIGSLAVEGVKRAIQPGQSYGCTMTLKMHPEQVEPPKVRHRVSIWELNSQTDSMEFVWDADFGELVEFKQMGQHVEQKIKRLFIYTGHSGDLFWFSKDSEGELTMHLLAKGKESPEKHEIKMGTNLYRYVVDGNDDKGKDAEHNMSLSNAVPTIIRDKPETPIVVFRCLFFEEGVSKIIFYDLNSKNDICQASYTHLFLNFLPKGGSSGLSSDRLFFLRNPFFNSPIRSAEGMKAASYDVIHKLNFSHRAPVPYFYSLEVDFDLCRASVGQAQSNQVPPDLLEEGSRAQLSDMCDDSAGKTIEEISALVKDQDNWAYCGGDDPLNILQIFQNGALQVKVIDSRGKAGTSLFTVNVMLFDPDADISFDYFYEFEDLRTVTRTFGSEQLFAYPLTNEQTQEFQVMKIDSHSGRTSCSPGTDMENHTWLIDWPVRKNGVSPYWFQQPVIVNNNCLLRTTIDAAGVITWSKATVPTRGQEILDYKDMFVDQKHTPVMVNYPLMATWHPWHQLQVSHLANQQQGQQVFNFKDLQLICFLQDFGTASETRINFVAHRVTDQAAILVVMRHKHSLKVHETRDLSPWQIDQFELDKAFKGIKAHASQIRQAYLMYDIKEQELRATSAQPSILYQTSSAVYLVAKANFSILCQSTSQWRLGEISLIKGLNYKFYYVGRDVVQQTDDVVEVTMEPRVQKWFPNSRLAYTSTTGRIVAMEFNSNCSSLCDSYLTMEGNKKLGKAYIKNQLYVLDEQLNLFCLSQNDLDTYDISNKFSLVQCEGLRRQIQLISAFQSVSINERCLVLGDKVFVYETGKTFNAFDNEKEDWQVLQTARCPYTDKLHYTLRHRETGQTQSVFKTDPGSRDASNLGHRLLRDALHVCFISNERLLLNMQTDVQGLTYWAQVDMKGVVRRIPSSLARILNDSNFKEVSTKLDGFGYILVLTEDTCVKVAKISQKGNLVEFEKFEYPAVESVLESTLLDYDLNIYRVVVAKADGVADAPQILSKQVGEMATLTTVQFPTGSSSINFEFCGEFLVWREAWSYKVGVLDMRPIKKATSQTAPNLLSKNDHLRWIDLGEVRKEIPAFLISLDACSFNYALHGCPSQPFTKAHLVSSANHLQINIGNRGYIHALEKPQMPAVRELVAMDKLIDAQRYVEPGFQVTYLSERIGSVSKEKYGLELAIEAQVARGIYVMRQQQIPTIQAQMHEKFKYDERFSVITGIFQTYSEVSMFEVRRLIEIGESNLTPKQVSTQALFACFEGKSMIALTQGRLKIHQAIIDSLERMRLQNEVDLDEGGLENAVLRRLRYLLQQKPFVGFSQKKQELRMKSCLIKNLKQPAARDLILKIGSQTMGYSVLDEFFDVEAFQTFLSYGTSLSTMQLNQCFRVEKEQNEIPDFSWPRGLNSVTYRCDTCVFRKQDLMDKLNQLGLVEETNQMLQTVKARVLNINWMFKQGNFLKLAPLLLGQVENFYATEYVKGIFDEFWAENQREIIKRQFLPYVVFMCAALFYMFELCKPKDEIDHTQEIINWVSGVITGVLWLYEAFQELKQFINVKKKKDYLMSIQNASDVVGLLLVLVTLAGQTFVEAERMRVVSAFASISIVLKAFDWLRLFEQTAFYILLIQETLRDILAFMILVGVSLMAFGFPIMYLNFNRDEAQGNTILDQAFGLSFFDVALNQYLLGLGEFSIDAFGNGPQSVLLYLVFLAATFVTQITMLNMLIAIMGDTFGRVMSNRKISSTITKLNLMSDLSTIMTRNFGVEQRKEFLFVVVPENQDLLDQNEWDGAISRMEALFEKRTDELHHNLKQKFVKLFELQDQAIKRSASQAKDLKGQLSEMIRRQVSQSERNNTEHVEKVAQDLKTFIKDTLKK